MKRRIGTILTLWMMMAGAGCDSLLFPRTGPGIREDLRTTPLGVLRELEGSYTGRSLRRFEGLFTESAPDSFRFYSRPDPDITLNHITATEYVNPTSSFVTPGNYVYLTYNDEIRAHRQMFENATDIHFLSPLTGNILDVTLDSLGHDTIGAVIKVDQATISITSKKVFEALGVWSYPFEVGEQIYLLKKRKNGLWGITTWFELERR